MKTQFLFSGKDFCDLVTGMTKYATLPERKQFWQMCVKLSPMMGSAMCEQVLYRLSAIKNDENEEERDYRMLFEQKLHTLRKTTYDSIRIQVSMTELVAWVQESDMVWEPLVESFYPTMTEEERSVIYRLVSKRECANPFLQQQKEMCLAAFDRNNRFRVRYVTRNAKGRKINLSAVAFKYKNVYFGGWNKPIREYNDSEGFCEIKNVTPIYE